jgi:hypothetical protein
LLLSVRVVAGSSLLSGRSLRLDRCAGDESLSRDELERSRVHVSVVRHVGFGLDSMQLFQMTLQSTPLCFLSISIARSLILCSAEPIDGDYTLRFSAGATERIQDLVAEFGWLGFPYTCIIT